MTGPLRKLPAETLGFGAASVLAIGMLALCSDLTSLPVLTLLAIGVGLLGLPHGALDPLIARQADLWSSPLGFLAFNLSYIMLAALTVTFWLLAPPFALAGFLLISAWHFAGDWFERSAPIARLSTGIALLCLPTILHGPVVEEIYTVLTGPSGPALVKIQQVIVWIALLISAALIAPQYRQGRQKTLEIAAVFSVALILPPLIFFLIYFCGLHSPRHIFTHVRILSDAVHFKQIALYFIAYTAGAIALLGGGYLALTAAEVALDAALLQLVFVGLAALTVPHMLVLEYSERHLYE